MPRLGTPEVSSGHQIQPRVGQFQYIRSTSSSVPVPVYLPHIQFQSTSSSTPVPVYFVPGPAPCVGRFSSHASTPSSNAGSPGLAQFRGLLSLQGLIFIACGISLLCKDSSSFTAHLNGRDFFEMWFFV